MVWCVWKFSIMGKRIWIYPIILKGTRFSPIFRQSHLTGWLQPKHLLECGSSKTSQTRSQRPRPRSLVFARPPWHQLWHPPGKALVLAAVRRRSRCIGRSSCGRSLAQLTWSCGMSWDDANVKTCQNIQKTETSWRVDVNWLTPKMALSMHTHVQYYIILINTARYQTVCKKARHPAHQDVEFYSVCKASFAYLCMYPSAAKPHRGR